MPRSADQLREQLYFLHPVAEIATQFLIGSARGLCIAGAGAASHEVRAASGRPLLPRRLGKRARTADCLFTS
jgi:hypothetical protein